MNTTLRLRPAPPPTTPTTRAPEHPAAAPLVFPRQALDLLSRAPRPSGPRPDHPTPPRPAPPSAAPDVIADLEARLAHTEGLMRDLARQADSFPFPAPATNSGPRRPAA
jgi:hypothetical protein